ncbi:hypothetical protein NECAME_12069 [Necator americanus]|uniref:Leishmanolysin-like peptidase n=1 Tax=Necator americanus TaxID=51031 RepID=W2T1M3_NECAM|nr:hypothetical protein NECAME_12069 [Necator americanus]ETN75895.1 hypothetical protein NECAME_12069 [Necator americanus]
MSGVTTQVYALSRITLALFEDSGWYEVNYDHYDYNIRNVYRDKKGRPIHGHGDLSISDYCPYYKAICENNLVFIKTQKSKFYPCYKKGQLIHVKKVPLT